MTTFDVDKADRSSTGRNDYFSLEPSSHVGLIQDGDLKPASRR